MTLIIDASVAFKWFLPDEPDGDRALEIIGHGDSLAAPDIIVGEVCNAAWKAARLGRISHTQVREIATVLPRFFDRIFASASLALRAVEIAERLDHPVYDGLYLALAKAEQARMITADIRLVGKVRGTQWKSSVVTLGRYRAAIE